ncbi:hypothetical protein NCAS_0A13220 [Naumovozyma castellii]|uniref:RRM domain-containing protein n=1 Tax=Naumovozyma castellii TaxID=27288 RepID=G0V8T1_NAUCA|nr:hypothetical protein NCAS_0A13220 [Naumovozyma castellii CBS 4309]CCC67880.1 hypothetical protein NCAS_0A13220 [Naumovozyma castellii CBS 4309]
MSKAKSIQQINERELQSGILTTEQSWHYQYKDQAYIYIGGLDKELTEGDIISVFSQYGVPVDLLLVNDNQTGESKGFAFLKYEDQRSTVLAIDNLNGVKVGSNTIQVDHTFYEPRDEQWDYRETMKNELEKDFVVRGIPNLPSETPSGSSKEAFIGEDDDLKDPMQDEKRK